MTTGLANFTKSQLRLDPKSSDEVGLGLVADAVVQESGKFTE